MGWASQISYMGVSALASYIAQIIQYAANFGVVWVMMRLFSNLEGFSIWQVYTLYSIDLLSYGIATSFLQPFWRMKELVLNADLDTYLIRPVRPLFYIFAKGFVPGYTAHMALALSTIIISFNVLGIALQFTSWIVLCAAVLIAVGIQVGFRCIPAMLTFWFGNLDQLHWIFANYLRNIIMYPLNIYPHFIRTIFTVALPYAFINYYPSLFLFGKVDSKTGMVLMLVGFIIAVFMVSITIGMFKMGLKKYESAGG